MSAGERVTACCGSAAALFLLALLSALHAGGRVTIKAPGFVTAPASVTLRVVVEPEDANRVLRVVADSGEHYRSTDVQINGAAGPRTSFIEWRDLPAGDYEITAGVGRTDGQALSGRAVMHVVGMR